MQVVQPPRGSYMTGNPDPLARLQARKAQLQDELAKIEQLIAKLTSDPAALEIAKQMASVRI